MLARQAPGRDGGEGQVLGDVPGEADEAAVHRQPHDAHGAVALLCRLPGLAQAQHVHLESRLGQGIGLAMHPRVAGEDGVDDDGDPPRRLRHAPFTSSHSSSFCASDRA
jgi:hypothetical protein